MNERIFPHFGGLLFQALNVLFESLDENPDLGISVECIASSRFFSELFAFSAALQYVYVFGQFKNPKPLIARHNKTKQSANFVEHNEERQLGLVENGAGIQHIRHERRRRSRPRGVTDVSDHLRFIRVFIVSYLRDETTFKKIFFEFFPSQNSFLLLLHVVLHPHF